MIRYLVAGLSVLLMAPLFMHFGLAADERKILVVPDDARKEFRREMSRHMGSFDEILSAVAEGDFKGAARIAENHMKFGHNIWIEMARRGKSQQEIVRLQKRYKGKSLAEQQKMEKDLGFNGKTHKPGLFNSSVQLFYSATGNFAHIAKNVGDEPTPDDYEKVIAALREITSICSGCHSDFRP